MARILLSMCKVILFAVSMYGWGRLTERLTALDKPRGWAFPTTLGIATSISLGGLLNLAHLAQPPVLLAMLFGGICLALFFVYSTFFGQKLQNTATSLHLASPAFSGMHLGLYILFYGLLFAVLFFLVSTLMPARSFNFGDDFQIYLMWPIRMLETGSLGGNPFSHIGLSSLGAQSFMQGMFLTFSPIADANAFDSILCVILVLGLLKELGDHLEVNTFFILAAAALALFINPHYVNISSLYSGSLLLLGLTYSTLLLTKAYESSNNASVLLKAVIPCSLFYAALLALKTTYVFMAPLFWTVSLGGLLLLIRKRKQVLLTHISCAAVSFVLLLPWLGIHLGRYIQKVHYLLDGTHYPKERSFSTSLIIKEDILPKLLSKQALFYGNTYLDYFCIFLMLLFALSAASWAVLRWKKRRETIILLPFLALLLSVIANFLVYYRATFFTGSLIIRYSCPLMIAAAPIAVLVVGWLLANSGMDRQRKTKGSGIFLFLGGTLLLFQLTIAGMFLQTFMERVERAERYGTLLSFPLALDPMYIDYNKYALSNAAQKRMTGLQALVPAGESILAWVSLPMYFDYQRNTIYPTYEYGISNRLLVMPFAEGTEGMRHYFRQLGIHYFIWDYQGYAVKTRAKFGGIQRKFIDTLTELQDGSRTLFNDGNTVVFDIGSGT